MSSVDRTRSISEGLAFSVASTIVSLWTISCIVTADFSFSFLLLFIIGVSFMGFIWYHTLASFQLLTRYTDRFDRLFYESRKGSLALIFLSLVWGLWALQMFALATLDLLIPGGNWWGSQSFGVLGQIFQALMVLGSPIIFISVVGWLGTTAVKALWRISTPRDDSMDHALQGLHEPLPQEDHEDEDVQDDGDWDGWKSNHGTNVGSSSV